MAISIWKPGAHREGSPLMQRHERLAGINETLGEYAELLEAVSTERAHLLKTISELQLKNAELSVGKALYADLEIELNEMRTVSQRAVEAIDKNRQLQRQLEVRERERHELAIEARELRQEVGVLKGQLTKIRNKEANLTLEEGGESDAS